MADYNARQVVAAVANVPPSGGLPERKPRTHRNHRLAMNDDGGRKRERFPLPKASGRFQFGQGAFTGASGNDEVAPKPAVDAAAIELAGYTQDGC